MSVPVTGLNLTEVPETCCCPKPPPPPKAEVFAAVLPKAPALVEVAPNPPKLWLGWLVVAPNIPPPVVVVPPKPVLVLPKPPAGLNAEPERTMITLSINVLDTESFDTD